MTFGQTLQCCQGRRYDKVIGPLFREVGGEVNHKVSYASPIQVFNVSMTIIAIGLQSKEQCLFRKA